MAKVFIYPGTSLILSDLVARFGHQPLGASLAIRERIQTAGFESPPLQITPEEPKKGLKYAAVEVPSGVRGRMSLYGPMIDEADAAVIVQEADMAFGCMGCARTNELIIFLLKKRRIPMLEIRYPRTDEEGVAFVAAIKGFLDKLGRKE
jgi:putative methanogenesis marker protein 5